MQFAWYSDLTVADPYFTLPILSSLLLLLTVELNAADGMQVPACRLQQVKDAVSHAACAGAEGILFALQGQDKQTLDRTKNFMRIISAAMLVFTSGMPQVGSNGGEALGKFAPIQVIIGVNQEPGPDEMVGAGRLLLLADFQPLRFGASHP